MWHYFLHSAPRYTHTHTSRDQDTKIHSLQLSRCIGSRYSYVLNIHKKHDAPTDGFPNTFSYLSITHTCARAHPLTQSNLDTPSPSRTHTQTHAPGPWSRAVEQWGGCQVMCVSPWILWLPGVGKETRTGLRRAHTHTRTHTHKRSRTHTHKPLSLRPWHCWISHTATDRHTKTSSTSMYGCMNGHTVARFNILCIHTLTKHNLSFCGTRRHTQPVSTWHTNTKIKDVHFNTRTTHTLRARAVHSLISLWQQLAPWQLSAIAHPAAPPPVSVHESVHGDLTWAEPGEGNEGC